jgi:hypothetical protein
MDDRRTDVEHCWLCCCDVHDNFFSAATDTGGPVALDARYIAGDVYDVFDGEGVVVYVWLVAALGAYGSGQWNHVRVVDEYFDAEDS